jgi:hypothetical protein
LRTLSALTFQVTISTDQTHFHFTQKNDHSSVLDDETVFKNTPKINQTSSETLKAFEQLTLQL